MDEQRAKMTEEQIQNLQSALEEKLATPKPKADSTTLRWIFATLAAMIVAKFGLDVNEDVFNAVIDLLVIVVGMGGVVFGRFQATDPVSKKAADKQKKKIAEVLQDTRGSFAS